jgi:hypothetical protein
MAATRPCPRVPLLPPCARWSLLRRVLGLGREAGTRVQDPAAPPRWCRLRPMMVGALGSRVGAAPGAVRRDLVTEGTRTSFQRRALRRMARRAGSRPRCTGAATTVERRGTSPPNARTRRCVSAAAGPSTSPRTARGPAAIRTGHLRARGRHRCGVLPEPTAWPRPVLGFKRTLLPRARRRRRRLRPRGRNAPGVTWLLRVVRLLRVRPGLSSRRLSRRRRPSPRRRRPPCPRRRLGWSVWTSAT